MTGRSIEWAETRLRIIVTAMRGRKEGLSPAAREVGSVSTASLQTVMLASYLIQTNMSVSICIRRAAP